MLKKVGGPSLPLPAPEIKNSGATNSKGDARDPKILQVAQMYEGQFLREMVRAMRKSVNEAGLVKTNMAEKIFREQLDDEYVDQWVNVKGGVGLSNTIYDQIVERYGDRLGIKKPQGPVPKFHSDDMKIKMIKSGDSKGMSLKVDAPQSSLHSPWSGKVVQNFRTPEGMQLVKINHANQLNSIFRFLGETQNDLIGKEVAAGDVLGKSSGIIEWTLNPAGPVEG